MQAEMYEITPCPQGRLAIMPRPRGGSWLAAELASLKKRGVTDIVSLLPANEVFELQLQEEANISEELCLRFHYHPIGDGALPIQPAFDEFITALLLSMVQGGFIAIHCKAGIGRSAVVAAALLCRFGVSGNAALEMISNARGYDVPDTDAQLNFIHGLGGDAQP
jgi:predicted protein tyrosine phosphatase